MGQCDSLEFKSSRDQPKVIEVLETAVGNSQHHDRVKLFRHNGFDRIRAKMRRGRLEENRVFNLDWSRRDDVPNGNACSVNNGISLDSNPAILQVFADRSCGKAFNATYLENSGSEMLGLKIWRSPVQPEFNNWAFNVARGAGAGESAVISVRPNEPISPRSGFETGTWLEGTWSRIWSNCVPYRLRLLQLLLSTPLKTQLLRPSVVGC
jgi:hypothetical protein